MISNKKTLLHALPKQQQGATTLLISLMLLVAMTLVTFFTAGTSIMEQKISANEYRTKQALEAAEAGLEYGLAYVDTRLGADKNLDGALDDSTVHSAFNATLLNGTAYSVQLQTPAGWTVGDLDRVLVVSTGTSEDGSAQRTVSQIAVFIPTVGNAPDHSLVSHGDVNLNGTTTIQNSVNNASIWSGGTTTVQGTSATQINDGSGNLIDSSVPGLPGPDVIDADANLAALDGTTDFFENFFGEDKATVQNGADYTSIQGTESDMWDSTIWLSGDQILTGGNIGSAAHPVLMIVDGDLTIGGNINITGLVYVTGDWLPGNGIANVTGAVVVEGNFSSAGTLTITYDPVAAGGGEGNGAQAKLAGSWKDF